MVTLKIQVPDAEDRSLIERWRYFFGIVSMSMDYIKLTEKEWERADGAVIRNTIDEVFDDDGKSFASRLYCHRENKESFMVYCNTPVFIIENGKTIDRIN
jgi:hypothetical protein